MTGKRGKSLRDLEQALRLEPLLPQRRALARVGARDQQAAGGVLAEPGAEQRRAAELADDQVLDLVGLEQDQRGVGRLVGVGQVDDDPVVGPDRVGLEVELVADPRPRAPAPRRRGRGRRTATGRRGASRRSRRGTSRPRASRRRARRGSPPAARAGRRRGSRPRGGRGRTRSASSPASLPTASREKAPIARPSSGGRPTPSPRQNGTAPGTPGAGVTITRSRVMSWIRQVVAPSRKVWPGRAS